MKRTLTSLAVVSFLLALSGCGQEAPPVATVEVSPRAVRLPFPELHSVRLSWTPSAPLAGFSGTPTVFVHLLDERDTVVRTFDHPYPGRWEEGAPVAYNLKLYQSTLAPPLPGGTYRLTIGLAGEEKQRWPLDGLGESVARMEYLAAQVEVPPPPANRKSGPRFAFSKQFLPSEPGGDRQVLARRWLTEDGAIRVAGLRQPGSLWLVLRIPSPDVAPRLTVEGGGVPAVRLEGSCGDFEGGSISGPGLHEVEMPVLTPPANGVCRIILRPNFSFASEGSEHRRSVSLENAAWAPDPNTKPVLPPGEQRQGRQRKGKRAAPQEQEEVAEDPEE